MAIRTPGNPIVRRLGITIPRLRGIKREGGPAATGIDQFWEATNVVPKGELVPRGGQAKLNETVLPGMTAAEFFNGMYDETVGGSSCGGCGGGGGVERKLASADEGPKLYHVSNTGEGGVQKRNLYFWDIQQPADPNPDNYAANVLTDVTEILQEPVLDAPGMPLSFSEAVYVDTGVGPEHNPDCEPPVLWMGAYFSPVDGPGATLWHHGFFSFNHVTGVDRPVLTERLLMTNPVAQQRRISGAHVGPGGKLYFSVRRMDATGLAAETYEWDGTPTPPVLIDTAPAVADTKPRGVVGSMGTDIYVAYDNLPNIVRRIPLGSAGASMAMPSGNFKIGLPLAVQTSPPQGPESMGGYDCWAVYNGVLYLAGRDDTGGVIYSAAPGAASFALARTPCGAPGNFGFVGALRVFGGFLYYAHQRRASPYADTSHRIGRFDGTTWTDVFVNFNEGTVAGDSVYDPRQLFVWERPEGPCLGLCRTGTGSGTLGWKSNGPDTGPGVAAWSAFSGGILGNVVSGVEP